MAVKIRLKRMGKRKQPVYRVVVSDSRKARSGNYIEAIGFYDPRQDPSVVEVENDRAIDWLQKGALIVGGILAVLPGATQLLIGVALIILSLSWQYVTNSRENRRTIKAVG